MELQLHSLSRPASHVVCVKCEPRAVVQRSAFSLTDFSGSHYFPPLSRISQPSLRCTHSRLCHMGPYSLDVNNECAVCGYTVSDPDHEAPHWQRSNVEPPEHEVYQNNMASLRGRGVAT